MNIILGLYIRMKAVLTFLNWKIDLAGTRQELYERGAIRLPTSIMEKLYMLMVSNQGLITVTSPRSKCDKFNYFCYIFHKFFQLVL